MIKFLMYLAVLIHTIFVVIGTAIGGLYCIYGYMACGIFLILLMLFLFGFFWMLEYSSDEWDIDKQDNK